MRTLGADVAAICAAALFAFATAVQHRAASQGKPIAGKAGAGLRAFVALVVRPLWLSGLVADSVGLAFHLYALTKGELAVVQPLLVTGLLFALPFGAVLEKRSIRGSEMLWSAVLVIALGIFLTMANPTGGTTTIENGPAVLAAVMTLLFTVVCLLVARTASIDRRATALGVLTGLAFGVSAALIKAVGGQLTSDWDGIFTNWPLFALLVIGPGGVFINQVAFQSGSLARSLPALTTIDPLVSIVLGAMVFDERLHGGVVSAVVEAGSLLFMTLAVVQLATAEAKKAGPC